MNSLDPRFTIEMKAEVENWRENQFGQLGICELVSSLIDFNYFSLSNLLFHYVC